MGEKHMRGINVKGDISGTGIVVGHESSAHVTATRADRGEILALLQELRVEVERAALREGSKSVLRQQVPELEQAASEPDPKSRIERALTKVNVALESAEATAEQAGGIVEKLQHIASYAGIVLSAVAPFAARLLVR